MEPAVSRNQDRRRGSGLLGVVGGMGPRATTDFLNKLQDLTPASVDQEHIPVLTYVLPQIPDRAGAILHGTESPFAAMRDAAQVLESAGAAAIVVPCNTAHFWFDALQASVRTPMISMIDAVIDQVRKVGGGAAVGLIGTSATMQADIYHSAMAAAGLDLIVPVPADQARVVEVIQAVKAGRIASVRHALDGVVRNLAARGARTCILGCTELPLLTYARFDGCFVDSTLALARACVEWSARSRTAAFGDLDSSSI
ncbi:MAG: aspartate/glutamate racemase family protein [Caulobacteraceae bacterium]|nr:aspartate/glutamate racemase family protein [Caulobacteraceae bacterium]